MSSFSRIIYTLRELLENMFRVLKTATATACLTQNDQSGKLTSLLVQYCMKGLHEEGLFWHLRKWQV